MKIRTLTLTEEQSQELKAYRDHDSRAHMRERCAALLKIASGKSAHWVARNGLLKPRDPDTVYAWMSIYASQGIAGLIQRTQGQNHRRHLRSEPIDGTVASRASGKGDES